MFASLDDDAPLKLIGFGQGSRVKPFEKLTTCGGTLQFHSPEQRAQLLLLFFICFLSLSLSYVDISYFYFCFLPVSISFFFGISLVVFFSRFFLRCLSCSIFRTPDVSFLFVCIFSYFASSLLSSLDPRFVFLKKINF